MDFIEEEDNYDSTFSEEVVNLQLWTVEGEWKNVEKLYEKDSRFHTININKSRGTALHVALNDANVDVVRILVEAIIKHQNEEALELKNEKGDTPLQKALESKNEKGDTPLHLAAAWGFKDICECIIGENGERKHLIDIDNNEGETPLFHAALSWQKQTFVYLFSFRPTANYTYSKDLIRNNGDSILRCVIRREFFDLALIILNKCPGLSVIQNIDGFSPLKLLATRPSAFRSGIKMIWWKRILYHCIPVGTLNVEKAEELYANKADKLDQHDRRLVPQIYDTCCLFVTKFQDIAYSLPYYAPQNKGGEQKDSQNDQHIKISISEDPSRRELVPPNYATCLWFLKFAYISILGLSGVGIEDIKKMKQKHKWSGQLLDLFMKNPYESYLGSGGQPPRDVSTAETDFVSAYMPKQAHWETMTSETQKRETAILTAARNGIVEMVDEFISTIPSSIHETNMENKNVLHVAVENRKVLVVEALRKRFEDRKTKVIFDNLIQGVDKDENTMLHLVAIRSYMDQLIPGATLQMMWHVKWFQYVQRLVPEHLTVRTNKEGKTVWEIFNHSHAELIKNGSEWLNYTSQSWSTVATLIAGASFATSSNIPGGSRSETGEPTLEGKTAFHAFALSSVICFCFSVAALIFFLSIVSSRKEAIDFRIYLPRNLFLGLSCLFISIVAMFITFCSGQFFLIDPKYKHIVFLSYSVTCLPVSLYAVAQIPLYVDLLRSIVSIVPETSDNGKYL